MHLNRRHITSTHHTMKASEILVQKADESAQENIITWCQKCWVAICLCEIVCIVLDACMEYSRKCTQD